MSTIPENARWVENRAECSVAAVFERLVVRISDDIAVANTLASNGGVLRRKPRQPIAIDRPGSQRVSVIAVWDLSGVYESEAIHLEIKEGKIIVSYQIQGSPGAVRFVARPTLSADGQCRLRIDDAKDELEFWQVSRRALEELLFG